MDDFLTTLLSCSVVMSVISLIYMIFTPLLSKKYSSKWLYYIWLFVVIGWIIPFRPQLNTHIVQVQIPNAMDISAKYSAANDQINYYYNGAEGIASIPIWLIIGCIWAFGVIVVLQYHFWKHRCFMKMVKRWSEDITDQKILHIMDTLKEEMMIRKHVSIKTCLSISSPMMIGFFHHTILLPSLDMNTEDLKFILRHELIHLKRKDLWYKTMVLLATAIHWFNPIVYFIARAIDTQCEISNDEILLKETSFQQRKQYGETLIGAIRNGVKMKTVFSTDFYRNGKAIKTRIFRIMDTTKKRTGFILLCFILTAMIGSGMAYASNVANDLSGIKQIVYVDFNDLCGSVYYEGPYQLQEGDIIQYNITSGNSDKLVISFLPLENHNEGIKKLKFYGSKDGFSDYRVKVDQEMAGNYKIIVGFTDEKAKSCIKGTIKIVKGREKAKYGQGD